MSLRVIKNAARNKVGRLTLFEISNLEKKNIYIDISDPCPAWKVTGIGGKLDGSI
jgi:hypothetical protein